VPSNDINQQSPSSARLLTRIIFAEPKADLDALALSALLVDLRYLVTVAPEGQPPPSALGRTRPEFV
jgi:hypothetical protein